MPRNRRRTAARKPPTAKRLAEEAAEAPVRDVTAEVRKLTKQTAQYPGEQADFLRGKLKLLDQDTAVSDAEKKRVRARLTRRIEKLEGGDRESPPPPGGVGYGFYYTPEFRSDFQTATAIKYYILCPPTAGGNFSGWLYLTAANRASEGVEAFVGYFERDPMTFMVWDWSVTEDFVKVRLNLADLADYITEVQVGGVTFSAMLIENLTYEFEPGRWSNNVIVFNRTRQTRDLMWRRRYAASAGGQLGQAEGFWGPIVETFQEHYDDTNQMGFAETSLAGRAGPAGEWVPLSSEWQRLSDGQSTLRNENVGFDVLRLDPNHTFIVSS